MITLGFQKGISSMARAKNWRFGDLHHGATGEGSEVYAGGWCLSSGCWSWPRAMPGSVHEDSLALDVHRN